MENNNLENKINLSSRISSSEEILRKLTTFKISYDIENEIEKYSKNNKLYLGKKIKSDLTKTIHNLLRNNFEVRNTLNLGNPSLSLKPSEILEIFSLRYKAFEPRNYNLLISNELKNIQLNFDNYDKNSILIKYNRDNLISGSSRLILDSYEGLPSENLFDPMDGFSKIREKELKRGKNIAEISRSVVHPNFQNSGIEFKNTLSLYFKLKNHLNIGTYITAIGSEDFKLYNKCGFEIIKEGNSYNQISKNVLYLAWDTNNITNFFERAFLKKVN